MSVSARYLLLPVLALAIPALLHAQASDPTTASPETPDESPYVPGGHSASLDLFLFQQDDGGGNPVRNENLEYTSYRLAVYYQALQELSFSSSIAIAEIHGGGFVASQVASVGNALSTRSSEDEDERPITVDFGAQYRAEGSDWTFNPSLYYFDQRSYHSRGFDFGTSCEMNEGDTVASLDLSFRWDKKDLLWWDDSNRGQASRKAFGATFGLTQILSPRLVVSASLQYSLHQGFLAEPRNPFALYNGARPVFFADERLPDKRHRYQLNLRARYALDEEWSLGADASAYTDSWKLSHYALEPGATWQPHDWLYLRMYGRVALQDATEHFYERPTIEYRYQTQDADLASFSSYGGGFAAEFYHQEGIFGLPLRYRASLFTFFRDDELSGVGGSIGISAEF